MNKIYFYLLLIPFILSIYSCREEIIVPENPSERINEPSLFSSNFAFIFSITAINMSKSYNDKIPFNSERTRLFLSLENHASGYVEITIQSGQQVNLYTGLLNHNNNGFTLNVEGDNQENILLRFVNFTGKLKIQLNPLE